jgi:predicted lysophospholipase L1 biosynthesis ABC-type transport system permease subunit
MDSSRSAFWQISVATNGLIYSRFVGPTPMNEMLAFIDALVAIMPQANARLVFDLRELGGYNSETKAPMKAWLLKHKLAIQELTVLVPKTGTILKIVVAAIALATGVKVHIREDFEEMPTFVTP